LVSSEIKAVKTLYLFLQKSQIYFYGGPKERYTWKKDNIVTTIIDVRSEKMVLLLASKLCELSPSILKVVNAQVLNY